jgi:1-acyl-sn-glycerol-3-phosphate acyltransferase
MRPEPAGTTSALKEPRMQRNAWEEQFLCRWARRLVTIPVFMLLFAAAVVLLPLLLPAAFLADAVLSPGRLKPRSRCVFFFSYYLFCEAAGLIGAFVIWLFGGRWIRCLADRFERWNAAVQGLWTEALYRGGKRIFALELDLAGADCVTGAPVLLLMRHASVADTVFPHVLAANRKGMTLRFVLKKELLWDPCIDVVGNRIRNVFVDRSGLESRKNIDAVQRLAAGLKHLEGLVIFPEGTRFHPSKLKRAVEKWRLSGDTALYERAARMKHVLPPRPGGFLALLEACRRMDLVFCAHTGLEGAATFRHLWKGDLIGKTVHVRFHKIAATDVPENDRDALIWLYEEWLGIDRWIERVGKQADG